MKSPSNPHKRQKLGLKEFSDSKVLSDITIRYGAIGERIFEAHRVILSSKSYWFKAAFTGGFAESSAGDITLKEDDPDALKTMLEFAYDEDILHPDELAKGTPLGIRHALGLYRVGDKYDFPRFRDCAISCSKLRLKHWLVQLPTVDDAAYKDFCNIVRELYDIVGSENHLRQKLVVALLEIIDDMDSTRILNNTGGKQRLIVKACQEVAPFGRDILLRLMAKTGCSATDEFGLVRTTELCTGIRVKCPRCHTIWWRVVLEEDEDRKERCTCENCDRSMIDLAVKRDEATWTARR